MQDLLETDSFEAPLEKELTLLEDYALIMRYRYFDRFHLEYDLRVPVDTLIPRSVCSRFSKMRCSMAWMKKQRC